MNSSDKNIIIYDRRFECQRCGFCCSELALIYPSVNEIHNIAKYLGISEIAFAIRYLREIYDPQADMLKIAFKSNSLDGDGFGCIFYQNNSCTIYDSGRTDICKVFPWNHFDLETAQWEKKFLRPDGKLLCVGVGFGKEWSLDEIRNIKNAYPNVGNKTKAQLNQFSKSMNNKFSHLSVSEQNLIQKFRSLSIAERQEIERLIDSLYHK